MEDLILLLLIIAIPLIAQAYISISYNSNLRKKNNLGLTGFDAARKILDANGLNEVLIIETSGNLTDHYDPKRKVIRLSKNIYELDTMASISVAAHEVGHAIQDKEGYFFLKFRTFIFPIVSFMSRIAYVVLIIGFLTELTDLIWLGIIAVGCGVLFQIITLPVEINASRRAIKQMNDLNIITDKEENSSAKNMLTAAALTYVAGALAEILQLIRLINLNRR